MTMTAVTRSSFAHRSDIYSENYESISLEAIRDFDDASRKPLPEEA